MEDPKRVVEPEEIAAAGIDDWRQLAGLLRARFATGDFAAGLRLVEQIGAAAEEADHHPDLHLTYPELLVTLSSHDVGGITVRDLELARRISGFAAAAGVEADPERLSYPEWGLDSDLAERQGPFYAALTAGSWGEGEVRDPSGQVATLWFQPSVPTDPDPAGHRPLPEAVVEQRWHLDVWVPIDEAERRVEAVVEAGGRVVSSERAPAFWVLEDPEGNRSCICTSAR